MVPFDRGADGAQLVLVQQLVAFEVERPVAGAGVLRDHLLLGIDEASLRHALVPDGVDETDLGVADRHQPLAGVVFTPAYRDHEFIDQRQQRAHRSLERKAELHAVAQEGEAADGGCAHVAAAGVAWS